MLSDMQICVSCFWNHLSTPYESRETCEKSNTILNFDQPSCYTVMRQGQKADQGGNSVARIPYGEDFKKQKYKICMSDNMMSGHWRSTSCVCDGLGVCSAYPDCTDSMTTYSMHSEH
ncbi:hypothetical protein CEXT_71951 [Caerostris extrusa]|uniref:Uncharacterized protein n=1 Tax=Caerostris extrusa TaxID=172846 RepID=A0AAV4Q6W5_CAEEX|nr:hypothetical protein CEXT_71951 [Caerostris extrusa]